jgi:hypothetical protein
MDSPENSRPFAERPEQDPSPLVEQLLRERDVVQSTKDYISACTVYFESDPAHRPSMLQLQRIAHFVTDPNGANKSPSQATTAFYLGTVLGYTLADRMVGEDWPTKSYEVTGVGFSQDFRALRIDSSDNSGAENRQHVADSVLGSLEELDSRVTIPFADELAEDWAIELTHNEHAQQHFIMGFRYVLRQLIEQTIGKDDIKNKFHSLIEKDEIVDTVEQLQPINKVIKRLVSRYVLYRKKYGEVNINNARAHLEACAKLSALMDQAYAKEAGLDYDDSLLIDGDALLIIHNNKNPEASTVDTLTGGQHLTGRAGNIVVDEVPSPRAFSILQDIKSGEAVTSQEMKTAPFGLCLEIKDPVIITPDVIPKKAASTDNRHQLQILDPDKDIAVYVVLNYTGVDFNRFTFQ